MSIAGQKGQGSAKQSKMESLADAREILRIIRKSVRQNLGRYTQELHRLCTDPDIPPSTRLAAIRMIMEYSTGGPPQFATAEDTMRSSVPDTEEYKAFREYQMRSFNEWRASQSSAQDSSIQLSPPLDIYVGVGQQDTRADSGGK